MKYILLKDMPGVKAGGEFRRSLENPNMYTCLDAEDYVLTLPWHMVEGNREWFDCDLELGSEKDLEEKGIQLCLTCLQTFGHRGGKECDKGCSRTGEVLYLRKR